MSSTTTATLTNDSVKQGDGGTLTHRVPAQAGTAPAGLDTSCLTIPDALTGKAPYPSIPFTRQIYYLIRAVYIMLVAEFPLLWGWLFAGGRNDRADVEGPVYISGAPNVQIADGTAIVASREDMEANPPYLLSIRILSPTGKPLPYAKIDFWQATSTGWYYNNRYRLRGTFQTDAEGNCEVLCVIPGAYGFGKAKGEDGQRFFRAGHFHLMITPPDNAAFRNVEKLTSQIYVCRKNSTRDLKFDFVNYLRSVREQNMIHSWSTPSFYPSLTSPAYSAFASKYSFPPIPPSSIGALKSIEWWNTVLAERFPGGEQLKVMAGGETTIKLNYKPWLPLY